MMTIDDFKKFIIGKEVSEITEEETDKEIITLSNGSYLELTDHEDCQPGFIEYYDMSAEKRIVTSVKIEKFSHDDPGVAKMIITLYVDDKACFEIYVCVDCETAYLDLIKPEGIKKVYLLFDGVYGNGIPTYLKK